MDTVREGESGADGENSINIFVSPYVKQLVRSCYIIQGTQLGALWWSQGVGLGAQWGGDICIIMADLCCGKGETNTTL